MQMSLKKANVLYSSIQALSFLCQVLIFNFASAYLLDRGFSNTIIGLILLFASVLSIIIMQMVAYFEKKKNLSVNTSAIVLALLIFVFGAVLYFIDLSRVLICVVFCLIVTCVKTVEICINSLYRGYYNKGLKISFPMARGFGSMAFAIGALATGKFFANRPILIMPLAYSFFALVLAVVILLFKAPNVEKKVEEEEYSLKGLLKEYPHFTLYVFALFCFICSSIFVSTYMLQIMQRIGGTIDESGTALFVGAILELPAVAVYKALNKKFGNRQLLLMGMMFLLLKLVVITFAPSPMIIWLISLTQIIGYGVYLPASERHVAHVVPASYYLRAQALVGSAGFAGHIAASLFGMLIDKIGILYTNVLIDVLCAIGVVAAQIAIHMSYKRIPPTKHN